MTSEIGSISSDREVQRPRLSEEVVVHLAAQILSGRALPGSKLPTEAELCAIYRVSRTVVRDAIAQLRRQGLVRVRQGIGTVVLDKTNWNELDPDLLRVRVATGLIADLVRDLLEIRRMVEVEAAGNAALRRTDDDLSRLGECIDEMEAHINDPVAFADSDLLFHEALLQASGNLLLRRIMHNVNQIRRAGSILNTSLQPDNMRASMVGHRAILAAVWSGDSEAARSAMTDHLLQFEHDIHEALTAADSRQLEQMTALRSALP